MGVTGEETEALASGGYLPAGDEGTGHFWGLTPLTREWSREQCLGI